MVEVLYYAIPFFVLLLVVEWWSFRHLGDDHDLVGYELRDTRASLTMGMGNVVITTWRNYLWTPQASGQWGTVRRENEMIVSLGTWASPS